MLRCPPTPPPGPDLPQQRADFLNNGWVSPATIGKTQISNRADIDNPSEVPHQPALQNLSVNGTSVSANRPQPVLKKADQSTESPMDFLAAVAAAAAAVASQVKGTSPQQRQSSGRSSIPNYAVMAKPSVTSQQVSTVWPDHVEAAFIEGLNIYPVERYGGRRGRHEGGKVSRNELISAHIFETTGEIRTKKQISSHIQLLKNRVEDNVHHTIDCEDSGKTSTSSGLSKGLPSLELLKGQVTTWPTHIEDAYQEALKIYPHRGRAKFEGKDGKWYGRNEMISFYIFDHTGEVRDRKQVSSHIQASARNPGIARKRKRAEVSGHTGRFSSASPNGPSDQEKSPSGGEGHDSTGDEEELRQPAATGLIASSLAAAVAAAAAVTSPKAPKLQQDFSDDLSDEAVEAMWPRHVEQAFWKATDLYPNATGSRRVRYRVDGRTYGRIEMIARYVCENSGVPLSHQAIEHRVRALESDRPSITTPTHCKPDQFTSDLAPIPNTLATHGVRASSETSTLLLTLAETATDAPLQPVIASVADATSSGKASIASSAPASPLKVEDVGPWKAGGDASI